MIEDSTFREQLRLEEYKSLKQEMQDNSKESYNLELYAVGSLGAFYSWYLFQNKPPIISIIPIAFVFFGLWRSRLLLKRIEHISEYIRKSLESPPDYGWEFYFDNTRKKSRISFHVESFWVALLSITIIIFINQIHCCGYTK
jgi:hypothetical protein